MRTTRLFCGFLLIAFAVASLVPVAQGAIASPGTTYYYFYDGTPASIWSDNSTNLGLFWERMGPTAPSGVCVAAALFSDSSAYYAVSDSMSTVCWQTFHFWADIWFTNVFPNQSNTVTVELCEGSWGNEGSVINSQTTTVNSMSWTMHTIDFGNQTIKLTDECLIVKIAFSGDATNKVRVRWAGGNCPSALYREPYTFVGGEIIPIQDGTYPSGTPVTVHNVIVVAGPYEYTSTGAYCFVQEQCPFIGPYTGVEVYWGSTQAATYGTVQRGDMVNIVGVTGEYYDMTEIDISARGDTMIVLSSGNPLPGPQVVPLNELMTEPWEGVYVKTYCTEVTNPDLGYGEWEISDFTGTGIVDDKGLALTYTPTLGDEKTITGILSYAYDTYRPWPRDDDDIEDCVVSVEPTSWGEIKCLLK